MLGKVNILKDLESIGSGLIPCRLTSHSSICCIDWLASKIELYPACAASKVVDHHLAVVFMYNHLTRH